MPWRDWGEGMLDFFDLGDRQLRVVELQVDSQDYRFRDLPAHLLHRRHQRLISLVSADPDKGRSTQLTATRSFYQWQPETRITIGDKIAYIELIESNASKPVSPSSRNLWQQMQQQVNQFLQNPRENLLALWEWIQAHQTRQIIGLGLMTAIVLWAIAAVLLMIYGAMTPSQSAFAAVVLLLGGYGDLFGQLVDANAPVWVHLVCLFITLISLLFVLGVLGLIAENLLSSRLEFFKRRPPIPEQDHIILVGLGRVGQRIANLLHRQKRPLVAITEELDNITLVPEIPLLVGNPIAELKKANLETARSVILVTDDQMQNLEAALIAKETAQQHHRTIDVVVRTSDQRFGANLVELLPDAKALSTYELSSEAFVGAAFGENILSLFRLNNQTILVAEYFINANDTLAGKILAQVSYGYGVVPILHRKGRIVMEGEVQEVFMPYDDVGLQVGDRLVVLSSINGLRRIERGELLPPRRWRSPPINPSIHCFC
ncbi:MAG: TrkA family potassium uptake protein [Leptolyngbyaceae cyanobacterium SL_7_1]|nr:TrkA family potassium uptake protein [Leptolyngbyaceae cyanobacterium SL_7_1]